MTIIYMIYSLIAQSVENPPEMQETRVWLLGWEDSPGEGNGNPLQYSCLENHMDRGAWQVTVYGFARVGHNWATTHTACYIYLLYIIYMFYITYRYYIHVIYYIYIIYMFCITYRYIHVLNYIYACYITCRYYMHVIYYIYFIHVVYYI